MKAKRLWVIGFVLAGLTFLFALVRFLHSDEPTYQGKPVSVWFKEYAFASNALVTVSGIQGGRTVITFGGRPGVVPSTNLQTRVWLPTPDPAWVALQALGPNAVPHLMRQLRIGPLDRTYERAFTNLPAALQRKLPSPAVKKLRRSRALVVIASLGDAAHAATPALLQLLKRPDPELRREVVYALLRIHAGRRAINRLLLELAAKKRYVELTEIAWETGWEGGELTRVFGEVLRSPDPALRRNAIRLLERVGVDAAPALEQVTAALNDSDSEVRYLAARSLKYIGTNTPQVIAGLRAALQDENVKVQNAARRALLKIAPDAAQLEKADAGKD